MGNGNICLLTSLIQRITMHLKVSPAQKLPRGATFMPVRELASIPPSRERVHTVRFLELPQGASFDSVLKLAFIAPPREHVHTVAEEAYLPG
jgi:hypothetical protein